MMRRNAMPASTPAAVTQTSPTQARSKTLRLLLDAAAAAAREAVVQALEVREA